MAKLIYSMNQSLDGYVDHDAFAPGVKLFRHFIEQVGGLTGSLYGRRLYEIMSYWDEEQDDWGDDERAFAQAWRGQPKWVVSRTLKSVGPNATLIEGDLATAVRKLKDQHTGEIGIGGPDLAQSLTALGLIDEYHIYLRPFVIGHGNPYFKDARPPLRLVANDLIGEDAMRLIYVPT